MTELALPLLWDPAVQQKIYRQLFMAMSYPGRSYDLGEAIGSETSRDAVIATMVDPASSLADPGCLLSEEFVRFCHAPLLDLGAAQWIAVDGREPVGDDFHPSLGSLEEPEASATLVFVVSALGEGAPVLAHLRGPGIRESQPLCIDGLHPSWLAARERWCAKFPQGVDCIFCADQSLLALPRTTQFIPREEA